MKTSYVFQAVNLASSLLLLVLILAYLDTGLYLQWVLFTAIGGAVIQLEMSLSTVMNRFISRTHKLAGAGALAGAAATARRVYRGFAFLAFLAMMIAGGAYLSAADAGRFSPHWRSEWLVYCGAFLVYYSFAHHACMLIALERIVSYARIGIASRLISIAGSALALLRGWGIMGLCLAMAAGFVAGAAALRTKARQAVAALAAEPNAAEPAPAPEFALGTVVVHAAYAFAAYCLYRAGLLIHVATSADTAFEASLGLALQIFALILVLASVPLNMRVAPLVAAVVSGRRERVAHELAALAFWTNAMFGTATLGLLILSGSIEDWLPNRGATLPGALELGALGFAFLVEVNILVVVNGLIAANKFRFAIDYYASAAIALGLGAILWANGAAFYWAFILAPALVQAMLALPLLWRRLRRETGVTLGEVASHLVRPSTWRL